jgi:predicted nucleic acid-binding Zn finger protein
MLAANQRSQAQEQEPVQAAPVEAKPQSRQERAEKLVLAGGVKLHRFLPSGREIWTAVGFEGDQIVVPSQPYCSCQDFHFGLLTGRSGECYHLLAVRLAQTSGSYEAVIFQDEEYESFVRALLSELPHEG